MLPTHYLKRAWFWIGLGTGAVALTGLIAWLWKTRPHGPQIQPVEIDFSFVRHPAEAPKRAAHAPVEPAASAAAAAVPATPAAAARAVVAEAAAPAAPSPDDLTLLIGIGPRIAGVLQQAGVNTFAQLAQAEPAWLRELLQAQKLRLADPESWPGQARLAAEGKWEEVKQYAAQFRSGRDVSGN